MSRCVSITQRLSTDIPASAHILVAAMDLDERMGHAQALIRSLAPSGVFAPPWQSAQTSLRLPPLPREWLSEIPQVYFLLDRLDELDPSRPS